MWNSYNFNQMAIFSVIITAGGMGKRMGSSLPKQFMLVKEKPILMYTIELFYHFNASFQLILTLPQDWIQHWEELRLQHDFMIPHRIVSGGEQRYHSIKNALDFCSGDYVLVHDGVRPMVSDETLTNCLEQSKNKDAVIPVVPIYESLRKKTGAQTEIVDRSEYLLVQTPQVFKREVLEQAYKQPFHVGITDDAGLVENAGFEISTVEGNVENIKITSQDDLKYAELYFK